MVCLNPFWNTSGSVNEDHTKVELKKVVFVVRIQPEEVPEDKGNEGHAGMFVFLRYYFCLFEDAFLRWTYEYDTSKRVEGIV